MHAISSTLTLVKTPDQQKGACVDTYFLEIYWFWTRGRNAQKIYWIHAHTHTHTHAHTHVHTKTYAHTHMHTHLDTHSAATTATVVKTFMSHISACGHSNWSMYRHRYTRIFLCALMQYLFASHILTRMLLVVLDSRKCFQPIVFLADSAPHGLVFRRVLGPKAQSWFYDCTAKWWRI